MRHVRVARWILCTCSFSEQWKTALSPSSSGAPARNDRERRDLESVSLCTYVLTVSALSGVLRTIIYFRLPLHCVSSHGFLRQTLCFWRRPSLERRKRTFFANQMHLLAQISICSYDTSFSTTIFVATAKNAVPLKALALEGPGFICAGTSWLGVVALGLT